MEKNVVVIKDLDIQYSNKYRQQGDNMTWIKRQNIGPYPLQNRTKDKMMELIDRSRAKKMEYGFKLCLNERDRNIRSGTPCKGKDCIPDAAASQCMENEKPVGIFYTHHTSKPSLKGLRDVYKNLVTCIGTSGEVKCFKRKKEDFDPSEDNEIARMENEENLFESERKKYYAGRSDLQTYWQIYWKIDREKEEKYGKETDRLVNSYFDVIEIKKQTIKGRK